MKESNEVLALLRDLKSKVDRLSSEITAIKGNSTGIGNGFDNRYRLTNEDSFFLTFIAAWSSTNRDLWIKNTGDMILLIIGFFWMAVFVGGLRGKIEGRNKHKIFGIDTTFLGLIGAFILVKCIYTNCFLKGADAIIVIFLCITWLVLPIIIMVYNNYTSRSNEKRV